MRSLSLCLFVLLFTSVAAAQKGVAEKERVLVNNEKYVVTYRSTPTQVIFTMEDLRAKDTGAATGTAMPFSYFGIYVDMNSNGAVDKGIDVGYGLKKNNLVLCAVRLIDELANTGCAYQSSDAIYEKSARRTEFSSNVHIVHRYTIPRDELVKRRQRSISVTFHCVTANDPFWAATTFYPTRTAGIFADTFKLKV